MDIELDNRWKELMLKMEKQFGEGLDLQALLFLIGLQELGKGAQKFSKDEKLDVIHIAVCSLLSPYGYYEFSGYDKDGWPHWNRNQKLPKLSPKEQDVLMRRAILNYMEEG